MIGNCLPNSIKNSPISIEDVISNIRRPTIFIKLVAKKQDNICMLPITMVCSLAVKSPDPPTLKSVNA